jgi:hypothetical protein
MKNLIAPLLLLFLIQPLATLADGAQFLQNLQSLCGARYEGEMTFPEDGQDSFAGKLLVAEIKQCDANQVRIPFHVGEDTSRTWIITATDAGLELKHDHRHKDGTPDEVTNYGGTVITRGSDVSQSFPADPFTAELIPEASTNVWSLTFSDDFTQLTYHLTRHDKPRFTAVLQRVKNAE